MPFLCFKRCCGGGEEEKSEGKPPPPKEEFVLLHTGSAIYYWDLVVIFDIIVSLVILPLRIGFNMQTGSLSAEWLPVDIIMDLLFVGDIVLTFFKTFELEGELVKSRHDIKWRYLKGKFALDAISTFPFEYIGMAAGIFHPAFRVNRLLRIGRLADFLLSWEKNSTLKPSVIGILKSVFVIIYMSHFVGCVFHGVTLIENSNQLFTSTQNFSKRTFPSRYMRSFYWALVSLTGYNASTPTTAIECTLAVIVTIISIALFGTIIGTFGNLLTNLDSSKLYFRQKMDGVHDYMKYKKIPDELQKEVMQYYSYMWKSGKGLEENDAIDRLPSHLRQKMNFHMNYHSICNVPLFAEVKEDMEFMGEIVKALRPRIGLPNSYIVKKGELGTEMFFISRGELNVVAENGIVLHTMKNGDFFGEIAVIYKTKRTASIVARTFCDMYILSKEEFSKVMRKFPLQSKGIKEIAKQRFDAVFEADKKREEDERRRREEDERAKAEEVARVEEEMYQQGDDDNIALVNGGSPPPAAAIAAQPPAPGTNGGPAADSQA